MLQDVDVRPTVDKAAIEREIRAEEAQWTADLNARDIDGLLSHCAPDIKSNIKDPGSRGVTGLEAKRKVWEELLQDPNFDCTFTTHYFGIADSGDWAYCRGDHQTWGTDPNSQKKAILSTGTYINVWRKDPDGRWRTVEDFLALDSSPQQTS